MCDSGESPDVSVCHIVSSMTSPSVCQSHEFQPKCDSTWKSVCLSVCPSTIPSIHLSDDECQEIMAKFPGVMCGGSGT